MSGEPATPDLERAFRGSVEAYTRGDFETALGIYRADAVWDSSPTGMGVFEGREAIHAVFEDWAGSYEDFDQELEKFTDLGGDVTLCVLHQRARLTGSSGLVEAHWAWVCLWANGLIERFATYYDIDEARAHAERLAEERR